MTYPQLPTLPAAPQRSMEEDDFAPAADQFVAALSPWGAAANEMAAFFNAAAQSAQAALAAANYLGFWADQSGSVAAPASVDHLGVLYFLVDDVANISQHEPGVSDRWRPMIANQEGVAIGQAILTAKGLPLGDYLRMDGNIYPRDTYETLYQLLPAAQLTNYQDVIAGTPSLHSGVRSVDYSPDGSYLAATHWSSPYLTVINTSDWSVVSGIPALPDYGYSVTFSPDGAYLVVGHKGLPYLTVINTADWSVVSGTPTLSGSGNGVAFSPDGAYLAAAHLSSPYLTVINTADWSVVSGTPTLSGSGNGVAFSPDGAYLATAHQISPYLTVINTADWSVVGGTPGFSSEMDCAAFSPSGAYLAVGGGFPYLTIIDTTDWSVVSGTPAFGSAQRDVAFSPDGAYLATVSGGGVTLIDTIDWSVVSGTPDTGNTLSARFSPHGDYLAIGHLDAPYISVITGSESDTEFRMPLIESDDDSLEWRIKAV